MIAYVALGVLIFDKKLSNWEIELCPQRQCS